MAAGWFTAGKTLCVALDLDSGTMRVSVDGGDWAVAFQDGCAPSAAVGAALFPALSGWDGARVRCNWGADAELPFKHAPPSGEYMAVGLAGKVPILLFSVCLSCHRPSPTSRCLLPCLAPSHRSASQRGVGGSSTRLPPPPHAGTPSSDFPCDALGA